METKRLSSKWQDHPARNTGLALLRPAILALLLAAAACQSQPTAIPESTPTPVPTLAPTPTATVKPKATPEPTPTSTAAPTALNEPTSAPRPTPIPTLDPFPDASYWNVPANFYGEPVYGGTLRIGYEDPLEHANIWGARTGAALRFRAPTGATLVMEDPYDPYGPVIPDLAGDWEIHEGQDSVTFHFRRGATWHNGEPFVCEDARFSFETMMTGEGLTHPYMQSRLDNVVTEELSCLDDLTLRVHFTGPTATPLHAFANPGALVFNKAWFLDGDANAMTEGDLEYAMFTDVSMGIGPFQWAEGQEVGVDEQHFERNLDYFVPGLPYVDELIIYGIVDASARQAAHLAHQTDWVWHSDLLSEATPQTYNYETLKWDRPYSSLGFQNYVDHDQILTVIGPTRRNLRLWINARNQPFDNVRVRQAIVMGIDRQAAIRELREGYGAVGGFGYAPGSPWELPMEQRCAVPGWCVSDDMEATRAEAREILEEEGFDFEKTYTYYVESDQWVIDHAIFMQEQMQLLGVKSHLDYIETIMRSPFQFKSDFSSRFSTVRADDPNLGPAYYLRCDSFGNFLNAGRDHDQLCDETIVALLDQAQVEADQIKRLALAHEIELAAMRQYSSIPIYWEQEAAAFWPEVRGYVHFPHKSGSFLKFMHMWIDPAHGDDTGYAGQTTGVPGGM